MRLHYRGEPFPLDELRKELTEAGAEFLDPSNEWEVLRYRYGGKVGIVYRNNKGRATPTGAAGQHVAAMLAGRPIHMSAKEAKRLRPAAALQLYTDASAYHTTGAASWGAILVDAEGAEHEASGPLKGEVSSSTAAEARAVANALHHFCRLGLITGDVRVVSDSQVVVDKLKAKTLKTKCPQTREALLHIKKLAAAGRITIFADWVKGHQPAKAALTDPRVGFNRRCDALAGAHSKGLHEERREAARMRADAIREVSAKAADPAKALHTETRGLPQMDVGCQREGPGLRMTGNPAQARELKPHTQGGTP